VTRGQLPQRAGSLGLNGGGTAAVVPPHKKTNKYTSLARTEEIASNLTVYNISAQSTLVLPEREETSCLPVTHDGGVKTHD